MSHISIESIADSIAFIVVVLLLASNGSGQPATLKMARKLTSELDESTTVQDYFASGRLKRSFGMRKSIGRRNRERVLEWLRGHKAYSLADLVAAGLYLQGGPHIGKLIVGPDEHGRMAPAIPRGTSIAELSDTPYEKWRELVLPAITENLKRANIGNRAY